MSQWHERHRQSLIVITVYPGSSYGYSQYPSAAVAAAAAAAAAATAGVAPSHPMHTALLLHYDNSLNQVKVIGT